MSRIFTLLSVILALFFIVYAENLTLDLDPSKVVLNGVGVLPFESVSRQTADLNPLAHSCSEFPMVQNAEVKIENLGSGTKIAHINCYDGYASYGSSDIFCVFGQWEFDQTPKCELSCPPPPYLENGQISLSKVPTDIQNTESVVLPYARYQKGTMATYSCKDEFDLVPFNSRVRVCEGGKWSGKDAYCKRMNRRGCLVPKSVENGFMVTPNFEVASEGTMIQFSCHEGFYTRGSYTLTCKNSGKWDPTLPLCEKKDASYPELASCSHPFSANPSTLEHYTFTPKGGAAWDVGCKEGFRNSLAPCHTTTIYCNRGDWLGTYPHCVPALDCLTPPAVPFAVIVQRSDDYTVGEAKFPLFSKITYECIEGYILEGNPKLKCSASGCWVPNSMPRCVRPRDSYSLDYNKNAILISAATGACVLMILSAACFVVACKKRRILARAVGINAPQVSSRRPLPPDVINDHAALLQQTDRLALIAFTEGVLQNQANINALPTYEEALRLERGRTINANLNPSNVQASGQCPAHSGRSYWPSVGHIHPQHSFRNGTGRSRGTAETGPHPFVARMGYCLSHTQSTRSAGDSMGSTDTVAISEGSTNVTLDTASSHSGHSAVSQNPSCRVHCGSLASFDACSANHEDVPLLEEIEQEECETGPSHNSDNISSKLSITSAPMDI